MANDLVFVTDYNRTVSIYTVLHKLDLDIMYIYNKPIKQKRKHRIEFRHAWKIAIEDKSSSRDFIQEVYNLLKLKEKHFIRRNLEIIRIYEKKPMREDLIFLELRIKEQLLSYLRLKYEKSFERLKRLLIKKFSETEINKENKERELNELVNKCKIWSGDKEGGDRFLQSVNDKSKVLRENKRTPNLTKEDRVELDNLKIKLNSLRLKSRLLAIQKSDDYYVARLKKILYTKWMQENNPDLLNKLRMRGN